MSTTKACWLTPSSACVVRVHSTVALKPSSGAASVNVVVSG
jgi:hypothetical protein